MKKTAGAKLSAGPILAVVSREAYHPWVDMVCVAAEDELDVQTVHFRDGCASDPGVFLAAELGADLGDVSGLLVLCDGDLMSTLSIVRSLRALYAHEPLLLITPEEAEDRLLCAYAAGVDECIHTAIGLPLLLAKLRAWLRWTNAGAPDLIGALSPR